MALLITTTLLMLLLSAWFSGSEIALISANKIKIELRSKQGDKIGLILSKFINNPNRVITTILIGNTFALVMYGNYISKVLDIWLIDLFGMVVINGHLSLSDELKLLFLESVISTIVILFLGEYIPKSLSRLVPDRFLDFSAYFLNFFYSVFKVLVNTITYLSTFFLKKILKLEYKEEELVFSKKELDHFIKQTADDWESSSDHEIDTELFSNAMEFNTIKARDCMVPRTEIVAHNIEEPIESLLDLFLEKELSRILIYKENLDHIMGYVHISSFYKNPKEVSEVLQEILVVPESMPANILLTEFTKNRKSIAIVVDEYGGTEGVATIEDLVEEVFGEIVDEHDENEDDEFIKKKINENSWLVHARLEVDELNKDFELQLPEGEYNTLAGLVLFHTETIPEMNEVIEIGEYVLTVMDASQNKINTIKIDRKVFGNP